MCPTACYVYILANRSKTLYVGVTSNLENRVWQHKQDTGSEFAAQYRLNRLVYFERYGDIRAAIDREKQIKGLLRRKKIALIVSLNPEWKDLSDDWYVRHRHQPVA
jgi:putative endonuclease